MESAHRDKRRRRELDDADLDACYQPRLTKGGCSDWAACRKWVGSQGRRYLAARCGSATVQVMASETGEFRGDMGSRELLTCQFSEFLESLEQPGEEGVPCSRPQLNLAQAQIWPSEQRHHPLSHLQADFQTPDAIMGRELHSSNLWMAPRRGCTTSLHYDQFHNILCIVGGSKTVTVFSPGHTPRLAPRPIWGESANHSEVDVFAPDHQRFPGFAEAERTKTVFRLEAGDTLFIPEGFWHCVASDSGTVAVNFWWKSRLSSSIGPDNSNFLLRTLLRERIHARIQEKLELISGHPSLQNSDESAPDRELLRSKARECCMTHQVNNQEAAIEALMLLSPKEAAAALLIGQDLFLRPLQDPGFAEIYRDLSPAELQNVLLCVKNAFPEAVRVLLEKQPPAATMLMIRSFEAAEGTTPDGFYEVLYRGEAPDPGWLQNKFVADQEAFAKAALRECLSQLTGL